MSEVPVPGSHPGQVIPWLGHPGRSAARQTPSEADAQAARASAQRAERRRKVWLRESGIIAAGYLVDGGFLGMFAVLGAVHWSSVLLFTIPGWIACAIACVLIARGHSSDWKDPSISDGQAFAGMAICGVGIVVYPEVSFLYLLSLLTIFVGATYRMSRRRIDWSWAGACTLIGLVTLWGDRPLQVPHATTAEQAIAAACGAAALARGVLLSMINRSRDALLRQREQQAADMQAQVERLANFDDLTGLPNRRSVLRTLDDALDRSAEDGTALSVARLGLDHFKTVNRDRGHLAGDRMLQAFTAAVQAHRRDTDTFGRLGGGEFLLILAETPIDDALGALERLRHAMAATHGNATTPDLHFTFSAGVAAWRAGETTEQLLNRADDAFHGALHAGRDRFHAG